MPEIQELIQVQIELLAGDPGDVIKKCETRMPPGSDSDPLETGTGDDFLPPEVTTQTEDNDVMEMKVLKALYTLQRKVLLTTEDLALEEQLKGILQRIRGNRALAKQAKLLRQEMEETHKKKAPGAAGVLGEGGIGRLQQLLADAGLDATAASVVQEYVHLQSKAGVQTVPCPQFRAAMAVANTTPVVSVRSAKELVKIPEFSGSKGYGSPDEAETWLRSVG